MMIVAETLASALALTRPAAAPPQDNRFAPPQHSGRQTMLA
jgi:hypothetical protein